MADCNTMVAKSRNMKGNPRKWYQTLFFDEHRKFAFSQDGTKKECGTGSGVYSDKLGLIGTGLLFAVRELILLLNTHLQNSFNLILQYVLLRNISGITWSHLKGPL